MGKFISVSIKPLETIELIGMWFDPKEPTRRFACVRLENGVERFVFVRDWEKISNNNQQVLRYGVSSLTVGNDFVPTFSPAIGMNLVKETSQ